MEAPKLAASPGFAELLHELATADPDSILRRLYGPMYSDTFIDRTHYSGIAGSVPHRRFVARRHPKPVRLARYLDPALRGLVAHDGSHPNRNTRVPGWWLLDSSGEWRPTSLTAITCALSDAAEELLAAARARDERELAEARAGCKCSAHLTVGMLPAAMDSLRALVDGGAARFSETAAVYRDDEDYALPTTAQNAMLRAWFLDAASAEDWPAGTRVPASLVWEAYQASEGPYLKHDFMSRLDRALRADGCARSRRAYKVPAVVEDAA